MMNLLYKIIYPLLWIVANALKGFFPKVNKGFELRAPVNGKKPWLNYAAKTKPIWIHAPSGEFEYALPVIRELKAKYPETKILVTYYTPSYVQRIAKEPLVDFFCPLPWDFASDLEEFIAYHEPQQLWIARTGFWPELLKQCARAKVPVTVFSMTFNKELSSISRSYYKWIFQYISQFFVVAEDDKHLLLSVDSSYDVEVLGDTRYDQCLFRLQQQTPLKIARDLLREKVFICASTWPEDEAALLPYVRDSVQKAHWIVVPHEIDEHHIAQIQKRLHPVPVTLYSEIQTWNGDGVLIVDQFGILASLYKIADGAFIGGSFKARVHSVMEALACGNITFVGPYHANNREALQFIDLKTTSRPPVCVLKSAQETPKILENLHAWNSADKAILQKAFLKKSGVSSKIVEKLIR